MSKDKRKEKLYKLINDGDEGFLNLVEEAATNYYGDSTQEENDTVIAESESDIESGKVYSIDEARNIALSWFDKSEV